MKVKVVGTRRMSGVSKKTGNPYDSVIVAYERNVAGYNGVSAGEMWIPFEFFANRYPVPGDMLQIDRSQIAIEEVEFIDG